MIYKCNSENEQKRYVANICYFSCSSVGMALHQQHRGQWFEINREHIYCTVHTVTWMHCFFKRRLVFHETRKIVRLVLKTHLWIKASDKWQNVNVFHFWTPYLFNQICGLISEFELKSAPYVSENPNCSKISEWVQKILLNNMRAHGMHDIQNHAYCLNNKDHFHK